MFKGNWLKNILAIVVSILKPVLTQVGKEAIDKIKQKIIAVASENTTNKDKFNKVVGFAKELLPTMKDSALNLLVESLVNILKTKGAI